MPETVRVRPWPRRLAAGSAVFIFALGLTVLAGWFFHTPRADPVRGHNFLQRRATQPRVRCCVVSPIRLCTCGVLRTLMNGMNRRGSIES